MKTWPTPAAPPAARSGAVTSGVLGILPGPAEPPEPETGASESKLPPRSFSPALPTQAWFPCRTPLPTQTDSAPHTVGQYGLPSFSFLVLHFTHIHTHTLSLYVTLTSYFSYFCIFVPYVQNAFISPLPFLTKPIHSSSGALLSFFFSLVLCLPMLFSEHFSLALII